MPRVLIIGANGTVSRRAAARLRRDPDVRLTLFLRRAHRLGATDATVVEGEPFRGDHVSLDALAALVADLALTPGLHVQESLGVSTS